MPPTPFNFTKLSELTKKFLKVGIDSYNSTDLAISDTDTDVDSLGERARHCLNIALHRIYSLIKESKYLEAYPTQSLSSISGQAFIDLDSETFLDEIDSISEQTTQQVRLIQKSWMWYRRNFPSPENITGDPVYYMRRGNRVYLAPTPSGARVYTIDYRKYTGDLKLAGDLPLIPTQFDGWIISEARVDWYMMEDPSAVPEQILLAREDARAAALGSILSSYDKDIQASSNCEGESLHMYPYQRPVGE